jgi:hypothetical protein
MKEKAEQVEPLSFNAWRRKHNIAIEPLHVSDGERYASYRVEHWRKQLWRKILPLLHADTTQPDSESCSPPNPAPAGPRTG